MAEKAANAKRSRRRKGEGSIRYREGDGRWEASVSKGDGTRKSHYAKTERDAIRWLNNALRAVEQGVVLPDERQSVAKYLAGWLERIAPTRAPGTVGRHREIVRLHIVPRLGTIKLAKLTPLHVQSFYSTLLAAGLSPSTVNRVHAVLHKALEDAVRLDLLPRNVSDRVTAPRPVKHEMQTFTPEQGRTFLAALAGERLEAVYVLAITTGMREGEILGLQWGDVDVSGGWLHVRQNLQRDRETGKLYLKRPKTEESMRTLPLTPAALDALKRHRTRQNEERLRAGGAWVKTHNFVFTNEIGEPLPACHVSYWFHRIRKRAGLPYIRPHDLRHTFTTIMREKGVPVEVVSELLGHANIRTTLTVYSHVTPVMQQEAAAVIAAALG